MQRQYGRGRSKPDATGREGEWDPSGGRGEGLRLFDGEGSRKVVRRNRAQSLGFRLARGALVGGPRRRQQERRRLHGIVQKKVATESRAVPPQRAAAAASPGAATRGAGRDAARVSLRRCHGDRRDIHALRIPIESARSSSSLVDGSGKFGVRWT